MLPPQAIDRASPFIITIILMSYYNGALYFWWLKRKETKRKN